MIPTSLLRVLTAMLVGFNLAACSEAPQNTMRVGTSVWPGYAPAFVARDLGYFSSHDIQLYHFQSASETIRGFRNGVFDVVALTLDEALLLIQDGIDAQIFLVADVSYGGDVIIAQPGIDSVEGLKGSTVGVESNALGAYILARALEIHNVPFDDVQLDHMSVDASEQAFIDKEINAVVTFEPFRSRLIRKGGVEVFSSLEMPNEIVDVLVVRRGFAEQNEDLMKVLVRGWFQAVSFIRENPDKAAAMIDGYLGLNPGEVHAAFDGMRLLDKNANIIMLSGTYPQRLRHSTAKLVDVMLRHGLIERTMSLDGVFTDAYLR